MGVRAVFTPWNLSGRPKTDYHLSYEIARKPTREFFLSQSLTEKPSKFCRAQQCIRLYAQNLSVAFEGENWDPCEGNSLLRALMCIELIVNPYPLFEPHGWLSMCASCELSIVKPPDYVIGQARNISFPLRVGSFFRGAVSSMEKSGFFRPGRNMFLPMFWKKPISSNFLWIFLIDDKE